MRGRDCKWNPDATVSLTPERLFRCRNCGEYREYQEVHLSRAMDDDDLCPYCKEMNAGVEGTLRLIFRKQKVERGQHEARINLESGGYIHIEEKPDIEVDGAEIYVEQTRGEAAAEVERREWEEMME